MDHKVRNVDQLDVDSRHLYTNVVMGGKSSADTMIANLAVAIQVLKTNWKGADAGVNIQNIIEVHNELVTVRNALAKLAKDSSAVAANYRNIQIRNGAPLPDLVPVMITDKVFLPNHTDTADTIDINPAADGGRVLIVNTKNAIDDFISEARRIKDDILDNWLVGTGRSDADEAFATFEANAKKNKDKLELTCQVITTALRNYSF